MAQFGAGSEFAAQCPSVPIPDGWRAWIEDVDGPIPDALAARAQAVVNDQSLPLGVTESYPLPGVTTLIRVEPRVWGRDAQGNLVEGCFRSSGIFLPSATATTPGVTPPENGVSSLVGWLTAASLAVGTAATIATWKGRKKQ